MAKKYIKPEISTFQIEVSEPPLSVESDSITDTDQIRFTNCRCWSGGWERMSAKEADGMTHFQIAKRRFEMSSPDWSFHEMSDEAAVRLIQSRIYLWKKNGKEHSEFPVVFETTLGLLRQSTARL